MTEALASISNALADAAAAAGQGIVRVEARRRMPASGVVWSADGLVITSHHVVEFDQNIEIGLADGRTVAGALVGRDPATDLALLRAEASALPVPTWVEPSDLRVGHLVLALGRPGRTVQAVLGVVSALGDTWRTPAGGAIDHYLQTDVVMYPGFSGGPLVDVAGRIAGVNSSALMPGVSVTVPVPTLRRVAQMLLTHGRVRRGYLGIGMQPVRLSESLQKALGQETGLLVVNVEPGGPAENGGLVMGDAIVGFEGSAIRHHDDLMSQLTADRVGQAVRLRIIRGGEPREVSVTVGEHK